MNGVVWMALPIEAADEQGAVKPHVARIRDYWLDGEHHGPVDRDFADRTSICAPHLPYMVRAQRTLLGRIVRYLVEQGVRQFLDLGSGLPSMGHVHEVALATDPPSRVIYVDNDPGIAADGRLLLAGIDRATMLEMDLRDPISVLDAAETRRLFDLTEPVAVLAIATLQHIPDSDHPVDLIAAYLDAMPSGSYFALSHYGPDNQLLAGYDMFDQMNLGKRPDVSLRDKASLVSFFTGLELIEPGIVPVVLWRPDPDDDPGRNSEHLPIYIGLGRKP